LNYKNEVPLNVSSYDENDEVIKKLYSEEYINDLITIVNLSEKDIYILNFEFELCSNTESYNKLMKNIDNNDGRLNTLGGSSKENPNINGINLADIDYLKYDKQFLLKSKEIKSIKMPEQLIFEILQFISESYEKNSFFHSNKLKLKIKYYNVGYVKTSIKEKDFDINFKIDKPGTKVGLYLTIEDKIMPLNKVVI